MNNLVCELHRKSARFSSLTAAYSYKSVRKDNMEAGCGMKLQWVVVQRPADGMVTTVIATVLTSWGSTHSRILINCSFKKILTNFPPWQNSLGKNYWSHVFVCHLYCRWRGFWSPWSIFVSWPERIRNVQKAFCTHYLVGEGLFFLHSFPRDEM